MYPSLRRRKFSVIPITEFSGFLLYSSSLLINQVNYYEFSGINNLFFLNFLFKYLPNIKYIFKLNFI